MVLSALRRPAAFGAAPATRQVHSPRRKTEYSKLRASRPPLAFQTATAPRRLHLPRRKAENSNLTVFTRASLSGRARRACPVHLPYRPRDSNAHWIGPEPIASAIGLGRHASG
jgi:hypothetical protein